jgi:hypothetical protein
MDKGQLEEYESGSQVSTGFTLVELPQVSTGFTGHKAKRPVSHLCSCARMKFHTLESSFELVYVILILSYVMYYVLVTSV